MSKKGPVNSVRELLSILTTEEKATALEFISVFDKKSESNKRKKLFELIQSKDLHTDEEVRKALSETMSEAAFERLVFRVGDKILESLIIDINIERENVYPDRSKATIAVRKTITQAQIIQNRGKRRRSALMFQRAISLCRKFELYEELILAMRYLIKQRALDEGDKQLNLLWEQYKKFDLAKNAVLRAEINYSRIVADVEFRTDLMNNDLKLREMLDELSSDFELTGSALVGYYYFQLEAQYQQQKHNYKAARKSLLNIQRMFEDSPSIKIPDNEGGVLLNLADNDLYLSRFQRSYEAAENAMPYFKSGNFNLEQAIEIMFYAKFYAGEYQIAANIIFQLLPEGKSTGEFRSGKRSYLLANSYFMMQDYSTALRYLNIINPIDGDKDGWNIGIKLLFIMVLIEMGEYDKATAKVDTFRKFFENGSSNHRAKLICHVLQSLTYNGYDFKDSYQKEKSSLEMLEANSGALAWQIKSSEMVIFHQWFFAKATRQAFIQKIPSFQLPERKREEINQEEQ